MNSAALRDQSQIDADRPSPPNDPKAPDHPKAMVILTTPEEVETWMTSPPDDALKLKRPLPDGSLRIVARGVKEDLSGMSK